MMKNIVRIKAAIKNFDVFNLGFSITFFYVLMFGALPFALLFNTPSLLVQELKKGTTHPFLFRPEFIFYLLAGLLAFISGYLLVGHFLKNKTDWRPEFLKAEWSKQRTLIIFWGIFIIGLVVKGVKILGGSYFHLDKNLIFVTSPYYGILAFLEGTGPIAVAIAFAFYFHLLKNKDSNSGKWRLLAWEAFSVEFIYGVFSGSRLSAAIPVVVYLIIRNYLYKKNLFLVVAVALLMFFIVMTFQGFYRSPDVFMRSYVDFSEGSPKSKILEFILDNSIGRTDQARIITYVFSNTKEFLHGATFRDFFISLGPPRFIWKNKPLSINSRGNDFGHRIGYLTTDYKSAVGPTLVGDLYINFGVMGIILGTFLLGLLYRLIFGVLVNLSNPPLYGIVIYSLFWSQFIPGLENWIAPVWAGMVKLLLFLLLIGYFLKETRPENKVDYNKP